jgi:Cdc6-like AAA superfamily ATPase
MTKKLLEEIEDWKLEAKLEDSNKYFYHTRVVERLLHGKRSYVVGRKGTGKTAISEHLVAIEKPEYFSQKLTFKNFPFNVLYELTDAGYTEPNQYITLWKYLIYSTIGQMLSKNPNVDFESREVLSSLFNQDITNALPGAVSQWTGFTFDIKVLGTGLGVGTEKDSIDNADPNIGNRVEILEKYIEGKLGSDSYVILFDELDEDYKDIIDPGKYKKYTDLLTSLFKAVQDIRARFSKHKVYPIVFLRDDIYDILQDPDKTKWTDFKYELEWTRASLQKLLAFRLSVADAASKSTDRPFNEVWGAIFEGGVIKYGHKDTRSMSVYDYITQNTQNRPRDYIRYLQICAESALEKGFDKVTPKIVKSEAKAFSNYLKSEMEDEIHGAIPEIKLIFNLFTKLRKQNFAIDEFKELYEAEVSEGNIPKRGYQFILEMLFMFSVIGNVTRQKNHFVFRYQNKEARLNMKENICVHRGLFKALQIL